MSKDITSYIKERENEAKLDADKTAKDLIVRSMQRYAADLANEQTVTVVTLPNDEIKGRIIRREVLILYVERLQELLWKTC